MTISGQRTMYVEAQSAGLGLAGLVRGVLQIPMRQETCPN